MAEQPKAKGAQGTGSNRHQVRVANGPSPPTLTEAGIDKHLADRARKYAAIPEDKRQLGKLPEQGRTRDRVAAYVGKPPDA